MKQKDFFKRWVKGTKDHSGSPLGILEAQLIVTGFVAVGCFLGAIQRHLSNDATIAYILFGIGIFQLLAVKQFWVQYKQMKNQEKLLKEYGGI